jgi:hypothetical protein
MIGIYGIVPAKMTIKCVICALKVLFCVQKCVEIKKVKFKMWFGTENGVFNA